MTHKVGAFRAVSRICIKRGTSVKIGGKLADIAPKWVEFAWFSCQKGEGWGQIYPYLDLPLVFENSHPLCDTFPKSSTGVMGCFTIRVHFQKLHSSPVLTVEAYFDFKVLLPKHWSGLGLPTAIKRRLESINFSKKYAHS